MTRPLAILTLVLSLSANGFAQGVQTGTIRGTVKDQQGLALPGVTITATSPALQGARTEVTDSNGNSITLEAGVIKVSAGSATKVVIDVNRNCFVYVLDRTDGKLLAANQYGHENWASKIDLESVHPGIFGRRVMITGAAGSIGSELCQEILKCGPAQLVCVDRAETELFCMRQKLLGSENIGRVMFTVADVGNPTRMQRLFFRQKPEIVFHAAAYKHVLMTEENVAETVENNALCAVSLVELAEAIGAASS